MPKIITTVSSSVMEALMKYDWQGNVRQLENVIYRAMVATRTETIEIENLPVEIQKQRLHSLEDSMTADNRKNQSLPQKNVPSLTSQVGPPPATPVTIQEIEKQALIEALKSANGNVEQASKALGVSRATFYRKIKKYKIE